MIKHLIRLDFYAMKPLRKFIFSFIFIPIILGVVVDPGMSIMVTLTFMVFMLNIVFAITERSNFNKLYGVLPIKKSTNILSRYLIYLRMKNLRGEGMDFPAASLDDFLSRDKEDTE